MREKYETYYTLVFIYSCINIKGPPREGPSSRHPAKKSSHPAIPPKKVLIPPSHQKIYSSRQRLYQISHTRTKRSYYLLIQELMLEFQVSSVPVSVLNISALVEPIPSDICLFSHFPFSIIFSIINKGKAK